MVGVAILAGLLLEVARGAKDGPVGPALLVLEGLLRGQQQQTPLPAKVLKVSTYTMLVHLPCLPAVALSPLP